MAELHVHGGRAIVEGVLSAIPRVGLEASQQRAIRHADPGEFTWRAFRNGLLDLTQAEVGRALWMRRPGFLLFVELRFFLPFVWWRCAGSPGPERHPSRGNPAAAAPGHCAEPGRAQGLVQPVARAAHSLLRLCRGVS